jgi:hypothetical protein
MPNEEPTIDHSKTIIQSGFGVSTGAPIEPELPADDAKKDEN